MFLLTLFLENGTRETLLYYGQLSRCRFFDYGFGELDKNLHQAQPLEAVIKFVLACNCHKVVSSRED